MAFFEFTSEYPSLNLVRAWHLVYYIPRNNDPTHFSKYVLDFKNGDLDSVSSWSNWIIEEFQNLLKSIGRNPGFSCIIKAHGSSELINNCSKPLNKIGMDLMYHFGWNYQPSLLKKTRVTNPLHTLGSRNSRENEISGSYKVDFEDLVLNSAYLQDLNYENVLIIDDVFTTGSTTSEILRALREKWPDARYHLLCLAKTIRNYDSESNSSVTTEYYMKRHDYLRKYDW
jgi:hypothetical protein